MKKQQYCIILVLALIFYLACDEHIVSDCETTPPPKALQATLSSIQDNVLTPSCATTGCHSGSNPSEGLLLTSGQSYAALVGVRSNQSTLDHVRAGESENSWIIKKMTAEGTSLMPPAGQLIPAVIDTVALWIDNGAEDN
jgi:hypothetical protein